VKRGRKRGREGEVKRGREGDGADGRQRAIWTQMVAF